MERFTHFIGFFLTTLIGASKVEATPFMGYLDFPMAENVRHTLLAGDSIAFLLFFLWIGYVCLFFNGNNFRK